MKMFVIMSHLLTEKQTKEIKQRFNISEIIYLPKEIQQVWMNIPESGEWQDEYLSAIKSWLTKHLEEGDKAIVQGEFGATFSLVYWLKKKGYAVYYATSKRRVVEETQENGSVLTKRVFEHVCFREYPEI